MTAAPAGRNGAREQVGILRLGAAGDGVAETAAGPLFVPYGLPGETVTVEREGGRARLLSVDAPSPDRIAPFCPYFARCGGCSAQHMAPDLYAGWKRGIAAEALAQARLPTDGLATLLDAHGAGRRRMTLHLREQDGRMRAGFMERRRHALVAIDRCPIAVPALADAPAAAATLGRILADLGKPLDAAVTATEPGLDIDLRGSGPVGAHHRQALVRTAGALGLARLSLHGEILVEPRRPTVRVGPPRVGLPPGAFLQATELGERTLVGLVAEACRGAARVADLFAGLGPFALRLAEGAAVTAFEQDEAALAALDRAARETPGLRPIATERRDLVRRPLVPIELARFDAVVLDPPRAGAETQVRQLAATSVPRVVMVSCDPGTFARDAALLVAGGYVLDRVTPVDQFKYGAALELVGAFTRPQANAARRRTTLRPR